VRNDYPRFRAAGGEVLVVTMGSVSQTAAFRERNQLPFACLSDPKREAYQAYRVPRGGLAEVAGPKVWLAGAKAVVRGGIGVPRGDTLQMPATFVIDRTGTIRFAHHPENQADRPSHEQIIATFETLRDEAEEHAIE